MKKWKLCLTISFFVLFALFLLLFFSFSKPFSISPQIPSENGTLSVFFCPQNDCEAQLLFANFLWLVSVLLRHHPPKNTLNLSGSGYLRLYRKR